MLTLILALASCDGSSAAPEGPPVSRVDAVVAAPKKSASTKDFCEVHPEADVAKPFELPTLDGSPMASSDGWKWVNVWATWCEPCVAEMPMLVKWQERLAQAGIKFALEFL